MVILIRILFLYSLTFMKTNTLLLICFFLLCHLSLSKITAVRQNGPPSYTVSDILKAQQEGTLSWLDVARINVDKLFNEMDNYSSQKNQEIKNRLDKVISTAKIPDHLEAKAKKYGLPTPSQLRKGKNNIKSSYQLKQKLKKYVQSREQWKSPEQVASQTAKIPYFTIDSIDAYAYVQGCVIIFVVIIHITLHNCRRRLL